jgi:hypothetical protein
MNGTRRLGFDGGVRLATALVLGALLSGCVHNRIREYTPATFALNDNSELHIATYPSWFSHQISEVPFLKKTFHTPDSVFLEMSVNDVHNKHGPNPHIDSILIKSFSYQIADHAPVVLIENYGGSVWMQGEPHYNSGERIPIPWVKGQQLTVAISLVLNGKAHEFKTVMQAVERNKTESLLWHELVRYFSSVWVPGQHSSLNS